MGWKALKRNLEKEMPDWANILPSLPRKVNEVLSRNQGFKNSVDLNKQLKIQKILLILIVSVLILILFK